MNRGMLLLGDNHMTHRLGEILREAGNAVLITQETSPPGACEASVVATDNDVTNVQIALAAVACRPSRAPCCGYSSRHRPDGPIAFGDLAGL